MMTVGDFAKKQILVYEPYLGDKISYKNDNLVIRDKDRNIKYQVSCYRIFLVIVIGDTSITTGVLRRVRKFGLTFCFMSLNLKMYCLIGSEMQGNTLLHKKQYAYSELGIAKYIIRNKILNQKTTLSRIRPTNEYIKEAVILLDEYLLRLDDEKLTLQEIIGIEGMASKVYFPRVFSNINWKGRKPRIKFDYINSLLDIGYTILFNYIDTILQAFGFDVYCGVLHTCFYMRKSLVCDIMEPFRPIIDWQIRKSINLGQFKKEDFKILNNRYVLEYKMSSKCTKIFLEAVLKYKEEIFLYIRDYYRSFMKGKRIEEYPNFFLGGN